MLSKQQVIDMAQDFCYNKADENALAVFYDDVFIELGLRRSPLFAKQSVLSVSSGTSTYTLPSDAVAPITVFTGATPLFSAKQHELRSVKLLWRSDTGRPVVYITDDDNPSILRLYPTPDYSASPAPPEDGDLQPNNLTVIYSYIPQYIPDWISLYVVFRMLEREFSRPSDHRDAAYASACGKLAKLFEEVLNLR